MNIFWNDSYVIDDTKKKKKKVYLRYWHGTVHMINLSVRLM